MPVPLDDCPWRSGSAALVGDTLPPDQLAQYERHLESCPVCQERIDQAVANAHALLTLARQVGDSTTRLHDPKLRQTMERLYEVKSPLRIAATEPIDLYFLRPSERPDILGTLGAYEVEEVIGQGGMGVVLKAFEPALHRLVAIKVMAAAVAGSATARRRFTREAQAAAAVCHEHIVTVYGVHELDGLPYLVMQYVAGESLQTRLDRTGPQEVIEIVRIGLQTASGLAAAHAQGLIHRDIKPANLLLENGLARVKITDFGLARMADDVQVTRNGEVTGTPEYMAPEQARGEKVDHRADLFSLGSVLYAMCTGEPPFRGSNTVAVLRQVSDQTPTPIRELNPDVPAWLEALINHLLAKVPDDRIQSAAEVAALLEGYLAHLRQPTTVAIPELPSFPADTGRGPKTWRRARWLVAAGLLLGLCASLLLLPALAPEQQPQQPPQPPLPRSFYQDFRHSKTPSDPVHQYGPNVDLFGRAENEGFHVKLPAERNNTEGVGVFVASPVVGNFEITSGYELVDLSRPKGNQLVGVELYLMTDTPTQEAVGLYRGIRGMEGEEVFVCIRMTGPKDKRRFPTQVEPATSKTGQLRVTRTGSTVTYWAADGEGGEFRELWRQELNTEDIKMVRMTAYTNKAQEPADVRIRDLRIRASDLAIDQASDSPLLSVTPPETKGRGWLIIGGLACLLFTAGMGAGALFLLRSRRAARAALPAVGVENKVGKLNGTAPSVVSFACGSCGKNLKARSQLAGKKVKCTQCAQPVQVPSIQARLT